ncbi:MAG: AI-2E family transporter [Deltaproteobacteria bacterium]|nr:AI-2E family transporter [Deltaproteobacteria bacterium]
MKQFPIDLQDKSDRVYLNLFKVLIILLIVLILMNGGAILVSFSKVLFNAAEKILIPLLLSLVLFYILNPVVQFLESFNLSRTVSILTIFTAILLCIGVILRTVIPYIQNEVTDLQKEYPLYKAQIIESVVIQETILKERYSVLEDINLSDTLYSYLQNLVEDKDKSKLLVSSSRVIGSFIFLIIIVPFFTFFFLKDSLRIKKTIIRMVPNRYFEMILNLFYKINLQLGSFIRARLLEALSVGVICFIGLAILDIKYSGVLAIIAGLTNLIPYIGPIIGAVPALFIAFVGTGGVTNFLWVAVIYSLAQLVDNIVIIPALFAKIVDMHPLAVVIIIIIGGQLGGIIGMILAVPLFSIVKVTLKEVHTGFKSLKI